ncbi:hypothetical protein [Neotamlana laminarinivorans]|uniref:Adhesin domain-containing protein n=1 Tax=Neotamlana laminarinivorans TaxID=2883124 RepID=A0A9X1I1R0_9FLAO|nr:hypothetical protein [Tamlana laminarinivorans]MCB4800183.1 hypothetical protein [Tamlana laminarinivorans]
MNKFNIKSLLFSLCFTITLSLVAQQKLTKVSQSIKVDKDVVVDLNTSNTNIIIDTWNKRTVEIEAFVEGEKMSKSELENILKSWGLSVNATSKSVSIKSKVGKSPHVIYMNDSSDEGGMVSALLNELQFELADLPEMLALIPEVNVEVPPVPVLPEMPEMPALPELPEGASGFSFDYEAYKKDGDKYLEEYSARFENLYGDEYAKKMEAWGEKFGKEWGEKYGKEMEKWAKEFEKNMESSDFEKNMEAWGEEFGEKFVKQMEAWGERLAAQIERSAARIEANEARAEANKARAEAHKQRLEIMAEKRKAMAKERAKLAEKRRVLIEQAVEHRAGSKVKKTIIIKMPKDAKLKVNVKHGEIEFATTIENLKADLAYTKFTANSINGGDTSINASYSPVYVSQWNLGELNLNYAEDVHLKNVNNLVLNAVSSNVNIENLTGAAMVDGNIGNLNILNIDDTFTNLNVIIQNSDAIIALPKTAFNFQFKGSHTRFTHPKKKTKENTSSFSSGSLASGKNIMINAKYCNVIME